MVEDENPEEDLAELVEKYQGDSKGFIYQERIEEAEERTNAIKSKS